MAIDLIGNHRFSHCADEHSVVDMTTYGTPTGGRSAGRKPTVPTALGAAKPGLGL
jgi:hypothetical protein